MAQEVIAVLVGAGAGSATDPVIQYSTHTLTEHFEGHLDTYLFMQ